jgi:hypothetical protein
MSVVANPISATQTNGFSPSRTNHKIVSSTIDMSIMAENFECGIFSKQMARKFEV